MFIELFKIEKKYIFNISNLLICMFIHILCNYENSRISNANLSIKPKYLGYCAYIQLYLVSGH